MNRKHTQTIKLNLLPIMIQRGLTVEKVVDLCEQAGTPITRATIYNLTNPYAKAIRFSSISALCNGLNIEPADLFTRAE